MTRDGKNESGESEKIGRVLDDCEETGWGGGRTGFLLPEGVDGAEGVVGDAGRDERPVGDGDAIGDHEDGCSVI